MRLRLHNDMFSIIDVYIRIHTKFTGHSFSCSGSAVHKNLFANIYATVSTV